MPGCSMWNNQYTSYSNERRRQLQCYRKLTKRSGERKIVGPPSFSMSKRFGSPYDCMDIFYRIKFAKHIYKSAFFSIRIQQIHGPRWHSDGGWKTGDAVS